VELVADPTQYKIYIDPVFSNEPLLVPDLVAESPIKAQVITTFNIFYNHAK